MRGRLFAGLSGRLLDAGVGTGRNIPFYPDAASVTGIDLSAAMLARAERRRARLGRPVAPCRMDACRTAFGDSQFDAVVASFLFCVLDDDLQRPALMELSRVCRTDGEIRLLEYTYSEHPVQRAVMRLWAPWVRLLYGAAFDRDTEGHAAAAGLQVIERRFLFRDIVKLLVLKPRP